MKAAIGFIEMCLLAVLGIILFYGAAVLCWNYPFFEWTFAIIIGVYTLIALYGVIYEKNGR